MEPIGLEHFFDAFSLVHKREFRGAAAEALDIPIADIQHNFVVEQSSARHFQLTPICVPDDPPAKGAKRSREPDNPVHDVGMVSGDAKVELESPTESDSDSSATNSDFSSEDGSSDASDLDKFEEAFAEFGKLTEGVDAIEFERCLAGSTSDDVPGFPLDGGFSTLQTLANVPRTWPLARLTLPLSGFSKQLERLLEGYCMEIFATNTTPAKHLPSIKLFAKDLVLLLAFHLAERISSLLRQVMGHPTKVLYDPETEVLFLPQFWLLPIYRELLNTASRCKTSRASELNRAASGLCKVLCKPSDSAAGGKGIQKGKLPKQGSSLAKFNEWFGSMSMMNTLYVWFPASWAPSVVEAIIKRNRTWLAKAPGQRDPTMSNATEGEEGQASREMLYKIQKWNVASKSVFPILLANTRVDWLGLEDAELTQHFQVLREGILRDVFSQRASSAWQGAQPQKVTVSVLLPCSGTADQWLDFLQSQRHFWPSMTTRHASLAPIDNQTFQRERRPMQSKHLWDRIDLNWPALSKKQYVSKPTGLNRTELWQLLFTNKHRGSVSIKGPTGMKFGHDGTRSSTTWRSTKPSLFPSALLMVPPRALSLTMQQPENRLSLPRLDMPADGKRKKAHTVSNYSSLLMSGMMEMLLWEMHEGIALSIPMEWI